MILAILILFMLNMFDVYATHVALGTGATELNPFMNYLIVNYSILSVAAVKSFFIGILFLARNKVRLGVVLFLNVVYGILAGYHLIMWF